MQRNARQTNRHSMSGGNKYKLESLQKQMISKHNRTSTLEESTPHYVQHRKQSENTLPTWRDNNHYNKRCNPTYH